jgi:hypothetical protein
MEINNEAGSNPSQGLPKNIVNFEGSQKRILNRNQRDSAPPQINPAELPPPEQQNQLPPYQQRSSGPALNQILPSQSEQEKSDKEENLINQPNENPSNTNSHQTTPNKKRVKPTTSNNTNTNTNTNNQ